MTAIRKRWLLALCGLLLVLLIVQTCAHMRFVPYAASPPLEEAHVALRSKPTAVVAAGPLAVPVIGVAPADLVDTYSQARDGGGRVHDAIDIIAPRGTPVIAAAAGTVEKLFHSDRGGNSIYIRTPDAHWIHYYAHLDTYRPGLHEGERVVVGSPLGTVGSTGNADPRAPHLHFAVNRLAASDPWYQGVPVNPYPLLTKR